MNQIHQTKLIREPKVIDRTGYSKTSLRTKVNKGEFPKPVNISERAVAWVETEVDQLIEALIAEKSKSEIKELVKEIHQGRTRGGIPSCQY